MILLMKVKLMLYVAYLKVDWVLKGAYCLEHSRMNTMKGDASDMAESEFGWNLIWGLKV